jgi:prepilin-type N-terminal cleavage/methylation domain-containing protein
MTISPTAPRRRGVTLIEMLVVMAIIVMVATITMVSFSSFTRGRGVSSAGHSLKNAVWEARSYAASHSVRAVLALYSNPAGAAVYWVQPGAPVNTVSNWQGPVSKPLYLSNGVQFCEPSFPVQPYAETNGIPNVGPGAGVGDFLVFQPGGSLDPAGPTGAQNVQIGLMGPQGTAGELKAVVVLFASGLPYLEDAQP